MKYHINPETGKVSACRAKVKCPFGGQTGKENHFVSKSEADSAAEAMMSSKYAATPANSQRSFATVKKNIQQGLVSSGIIADAASLPSVKTEEELVKQWFGGDRRKFELVAQISDPRSHLTSNTRKSMGKLVASGAEVSMAKKGSFDKAPSDRVSNVELIDEIPEDSVSRSSKPF